MSSIIDPSKLKVVELRAELSSRGLDTKGNKPVLIQRLKEALEKELRQGDNSVGSAEQDEDNKPDINNDEDCLMDSTDSVAEAAKVEETEVVEETSIPKETNDVVEDKPDEPKAESFEIPEEQSDVTEKKDEVTEQNGEHIKEVTKDLDPEEEEKLLEDSTSNAEEEDVKEANTEIDLEEKEKGPENKDKETNNVIDDQSESRGEKRKHSPSPTRSQNKRSKSPIKEDEPEIDNDKVQLSWYDSDLHLQVDKETFLSAKPYHDGAFGYIWAGVRASHGVTSGKVCFEVKITEELKWEDIIKQPEKAKTNIDKGKDKKPDNVPMETNTESKEAAENETSEKDKPPEEEKSDMVVEENVEKNVDEENVEKSVDEENVEKSVDEENVEGNVEEKAEGEKVAENDEKDVEMKEDDTQQENPDPIVEEIIPHLIRVGWSLSSTDLQLGESEHSFGYESSGKFVNNGNFSEYGVPFKVGDVVGAYLDIDDENVTLTYAVNGEVQPVALTFPKSELPEENCAFFPHVLSKNYSFELNLGNRENAWFSDVENLTDYVFLDKIENKVAGPSRPNDRNECEVIMMCGLPGSGKTHWVHDYLKKNPEKKYTVLGNSFLLNKMTVNGNPLKNNYKNCWTLLLDKLSKSLNKLVEIAALRRRNYILDQTNVYPSAQRRKMRSFEGFKRRAVVVVISDEDQQTRRALQEENGEKDAPDNVVLEMKACISIPRTGDFLEEVTYAELNEEESKAQVQKYNTQGKQAGYGPGNQNQIKSRHDNRSRWQNRRDSRGNYRDQRHYNNRYDRNNSQNRHGYWQQRSGGSWNNRNDTRRDNRIPPRDYRNNRGTSPRYPERPRQEPRKNNFNARRPNYSQNRNPSGSWQMNSSGSSWSGSPNAWSNQSPSYQNWNQNQGGWSSQGQSQYKPYNQQSYNQQPQQSQQGYGYSNWNYYGQYAQNWNSQGQANTSSLQTSQSGQYSEMTPQQQQAWAYSQYNTQNSQQTVQK